MPSSDQLPTRTPNAQPPAGLVRFAILRPMTLFPLVIGGAALVGMFALAHPIIFGVLAFLGFGTAAISVFFLALARKAQTLAASAPSSSVGRTRGSIDWALSRAKYDLITGTQASQALDQMRQAQEKLAAFQKLLAQKMDPNELTYGRYLTAAEQVQLAVFDQLHEIAHLINGVLAMDIGAAQDRLRALRDMAKAQTLGATDAQEIATIEERLKLKDQQLERIRDCLVRNEQALTELDRVSLAISDIKTRRGEAAMDLGSSLKELEELAARAKKYSIE